MVKLKEADTFYGMITCKDSDSHKVSYFHGVIDQEFRQEMTQGVDKR